MSGWRATRAMDSKVSATGHIGRPTALTRSRPKWRCIERSEPQTFRVGHFQVVFANQEAGTAGTLHAASSGGYSATLALTSTITVSSIGSATGLPGLQRSAPATDQAAKDLVAKAFGQCAGARAAAQADCPQGLAVPDVSNVSWTLSGDPLSTATVSFDPQSGLFTSKATSI